MTIPMPGTTLPAASAHRRACALADRLELGARYLADFASTLTEEQWQRRVPRDGRKIGVTVHHVASMYPIEIDLSRKLAAGLPIEGVSWDDVAAINAAHATEFDAVTKAEALALLEKNSAEAAAAIRKLTDADLDRSAPVSLYSDALLTCQFFVEDHAVRHSWHHLSRIRAALAS